MPDLTGTRQSRRDGFIDNGSGTAMQPIPRDELKDYSYCMFVQYSLQTAGVPQFVQNFIVLNGRQTSKGAVCSKHYLAKTGLQSLVSL